MKFLKRCLLIFCVISMVITSLLPFSVISAPWNQPVYYEGFDVTNLDLSKMPTDWYEFTKNNYCGTIIDVKSPTELTVVCFDIRTWAPSVRLSDGALVLVRFKTNDSVYFSSWHYGSNGFLHASDKGRTSYVVGSYNWSKDSDSYISSSWSESIGRVDSFYVNPPAGVSGNPRNLEFYHGFTISPMSASDVYLKGSVCLVNDNGQEVNFSHQYVVNMPCEAFRVSDWPESSAVLFSAFPDDSKKYVSRTMYGLDDNGAPFLTQKSNAINSANKWVARELSNFPTFESQDANTQKGILSAIKDIPSKIGTFFSELASSIGSFFGQLGDRISGFFSELTNKIQGFFTDLTNKIQGFFTTLKNYLLWFNADGENSYSNPFENLLDDLKIKIDGYVKDVEAFNATLDDTLSGVVGYIEQGSTAIQMFLTGVPLISAFLLFFIVFCVVRKVVGR